jgi:hypothetical protein
MVSPLDWVEHKIPMLFGRHGVEGKNSVNEVPGMGEVISAELRFLRKYLINKLETGQYIFPPGEMVTLLSIINDFLESGNRSFLSLLFSVLDKGMEPYIMKLICLKSQLSTKKVKDNVQNTAGFPDWPR